MVFFRGFCEDRSSYTQLDTKVFFLSRGGWRAPVLCSRGVVVRGSSSEEDEVGA